MAAPRPRYFATPEDFRLWLEKNHGSAAELWVGFHRKHTGRPSLTWPQSVEQALCFGWIDGVRKRIDEDRYVIRFTPRKPSSNWSKINVRKVAELTAQGLMRPAGLRVFEQRAEARTGVYSFEQREAATLDAEMARRFRANRAAWTYWRSCPPGYRKIAAWWVVSAKKPETRERRLAILVEDSANHRRIALLARPGRDR